MTDDEFEISLHDFLPEEEEDDDLIFLDVEYEDDGEYDSFEDLKAFDDEDVEEEE